LYGSIRCAYCKLFMLSFSSELYRSEFIDLSFSSESYRSECYRSEFLDLSYIDLLYSDSCSLLS
jgi:hypothetical protein